MTEEVILKVGLTPKHQCSYLGHEQEQLLVLMDHSLLNASGYERLLTAGFRRSGNDIYRPHCPACSACQSLRIHSERFVPSRSQKRIRQLNQDIELVLSYDDKPEYYQLYERYIRERHHDGSMYPPSRTQYKGFLHCDLLVIGAGPSGLMAALDEINSRFGRGNVRLGLARKGGEWRMRQENLSPSFTTRWGDIPAAKMG